MSEYQYYEFQAIDRPLTAKEQDEIRKHSSRVKLTSTQAIFEYHYGDFRGGPEEVLAKYFDMMFYIANWGTWRLMFRFPKAVVNPDWFQPYLLPDTITVSTTSKHLILDIQIQEEEGVGGWIKGEDWMPRLLPLRDQLLQGDLRLLYLVWLRTAPYLANYDLEDDPVEAPIPPNLDKLDKPLQAFVELVELDPDWVAAAAQASLRQKPVAAPPLEDWLAELPAAEKEEFLLKLVRREPHVDLQLIERLKDLAGVTQPVPQLNPGHRRLSELQTIAETIGKKRHQQEQTAARKQRIKQLEALVPKAAQTWKRVTELIELKQAKPYDEATALLIDLHDLAEYQGQLPEFTRRFEQLKSTYQSRPALMARFKAIKL
jgi:hypothetical protein